MSTFCQLQPPMRFFSSLAAVVLSVAPVARGYDLTPGKAFPQIELPTTSGERMSVANFQGEKLMLHLFASW